MDLTIRKANLSDAAAMAEIHMRSWEVAYDGIIPVEAIAERNAKRPAVWQNILSNEHDNYIALLEEVPVGMMGVIPSRDDDMAEAGEVGAIYLHPSYFGRGIGCEMMNFAEKTLKENGCNIIILWVLEENMRARKFYEKCGYAFDGTKKELIIGKPLIEIRYRKDLI